MGSLDSLARSDAQQSAHRTTPPREHREQQTLECLLVLSQVNLGSNKNHLLCTHEGGVRWRQSQNNRALTGTLGQWWCNSGHHFSATLSNDVCFTTLKHTKKMSVLG